MILTKIRVKATMIPYSRSRAVSSEDLRDKPLPRKVRKSSELIMGGVFQSCQTASTFVDYQVISLRTRGCKLRYLQNVDNLSLSCSRLVLPFEALHGPNAIHLRSPICSIYLDST